MDFVKQEPISVSALIERLIDLSKEVGTGSFLEMTKDLESQGVEACKDPLSTRLMEVYRDTGSPKAFSIIYELNNRSFFLTILGRLRRQHYLLDANDVLQEVFVNIYRYPLRFKADRPAAFRYWSGTIIRNTTLRFLKGMAKETRIEHVLDDMLEPEDECELTPQEKLIRTESVQDCYKVWFLYLNLYLREYNRLNSRERQALHLVEVEGFSYKEVSEEIGIKVENLKMVIFRARRKIIRNLQKRLDAGVSDSCKVASP